MPTPPPPPELQALLALLSQPNTEDRDAVQALQFVREARGRLRTYETELAHAAHEDGKSWEKIGRALGMTKQGAMRRYES